MGNRGVVRGTRQSDLLPKSWIGDLYPPTPITSNIMNVAYMQGVQTNQCALIPDAIPAADLQKNIGLALDLGDFGHPYDPLNPGSPGVNGSTPPYLVGGNIIGANTPKATTGFLWNSLSGGPPIIYDDAYPGGARLGGNMNMTGHIVSLGGIYLTGAFTVNSPPVDPENQFYDIWVNRSYTITGSSSFGHGTAASGRPNYFAAAFTPTITTNTSNDTADVYGGVLSAPTVTVASVSTYGPIATTSLLYAKTLGTGTGTSGVFNTPPTAHFAQVTPSGNWFSQTGSTAYASWSDISPTTSTIISNGIIHNQTVAFAGQTFQITGHVVGTAFSASVPGVGSGLGGQTVAGVASSASVTGQIWGAVLGYPSQFQVANLFGTYSTTAPVYAVDIQGTGSLGAIGFATTASVAATPSSQNAAMQFYTGSGGSNRYLLITFNDGGTTRYLYTKATGASGTMTWTAATSLPT